VSDESGKILIHDQLVVSLQHFAAKHQIAFLELSEVPRQFQLQQVNKGCSWISPNRTTSEWTHRSSISRYPNSLPPRQRGDTQVCHGDGPAQSHNDSFTAH